MWVGAAVTTISVQVVAVLASDVSCGNLALILFYGSPRYFLAPWFASAFLASLLDHRGRFLAGSKTHIWTWRYGVASLVMSFWEPIVLVRQCGASDVVRTVFLIALYVLTIVQVVTWGALTYVSLLKLRVLADAVPCRVWIGERCFWALAPAMALGGVFYVLHGMLHSSFTLMGGVFAGIATLVLYITVSVCVVGALRLTSVAALTMAEEVDSTDAEAKALEKAAAWTRLTAAVTAGAAGSTIAYICALEADGVLMSAGYRTEAHVQVSAFSTLDVLFNSLAAGLLGGFWGPVMVPVEMEEALQLVADAAVRQEMFQEVVAPGTN